MKDKISNQERLIWELKREFELNQKLKSNVVFRGCSLREQELVDVIVKGRKSTEQLLKDLDFEVNK